MRVLVVAPYPPRRDGIAVYARDQVRAFRHDGHHVTVLSPPDGEGDVRAEFAGGAALRAARRLTPAHDRVVVHFQPTLYLPPRRPVAKVGAALALRTLVAGGLGRRVELVVHEADPPALWRPDYLLLRSAFSAAGMLTFHTAAERAALERDYRTRVRGRVVEHRVAAAASPGVRREEAREAVAVPADAGVMFLCPGFLQPSKGYERAVDAFERASAGARRRASLYVVGSVREPSAENLAYARELAVRMASVPRATLVHRFVGDEEFDRWVAAADRVVLPYRRAWSSGVLARAHAIGTPAIVSRVGGLAEQAGPNDVVVGDDAALAAAMRKAIDG